MEALIGLTPATAAQAQPAVAISAEVSLRSAAVHEVAAVLPSPAAVVLFCVNTGLHLAPVLLLKGAICKNKHISRYDCFGERDKTCPART